MTPCSPRPAAQRPGRIWPLVAVLALTACATTPPAYRAPTVLLPQQFRYTLPGSPTPDPLARANPSAASAGAASGAVAPAAVSAAQPLDAAHLRDWWHLFGNADLDHLVDRALANNLDLQVATARLQQGHMLSEEAEAGRSPVVGLSYQGITQRANAPTVGTLNTNGAADYHALQLSLSLTPDWRGERSAMAESARLQLLRGSYARQDVRRTLIANVVSLYLDWLALNDRIRVARQGQQALDGMLQSVKGRMEGGDATAIDYEQQRAAVQAVRATLPVLALQRETTANNLALLLGVPSSALALPADAGLDSVQFPVLQGALPAHLVLVRPDVHVAEMRLLAADADLAAARARLLPGVDLATNVGYGAAHLSNLITPAGFYWSAIASLSTTLFDHGARQSAVGFSAAFKEELVASYVQSLYGALRESEDALATVHYSDERLAAQTEATDAAHLAWTHSQTAYAAGALDYLVLLDTQRTWLGQVDTLQTVRRDRLKGLVALFGALGGGTLQEHDDATYVADAVVQPTLAGGSAGSAGSAVSAGADPAHSAWRARLPGLHDPDGVARVRDDLTWRFAAAMEGHPVEATAEGELHDRNATAYTWYRVAVAGFATEDEAQTFCALLKTQLQRCLPERRDAAAGADTGARPQE